MTLRLIIARHGNTFEQGQTPTRVGARTDLPLVESGENQALKLGHHLAAQGLVPTMMYTSQLRRAVDTGRLCALTMHYDGDRTPIAALNEIDYGAQENLPESEVTEQLGAFAIEQWDAHAVMPTGWSPRPEMILAALQKFLSLCRDQHDGQTVMCVTSNGIARFFLSLADNGHHVPMKLATGAYGVLTFDGTWQVTGWNIRP